MTRLRVIAFPIARIAIALTIAGALAAGASCKPDLGPPDSLVQNTRILAIRAEPPEAKLGATVIYRSLVVSPLGTIDDPGLTWSFCSAPKPVTENNIVSTACLGWLDPFAGPGPVAAGVTPGDACSSFGPDAPPGGFRPRDADVTGGYYQPVRATLDGLDAFLLERVTCNLANTSADLAREYAQNYAPNVNPSLGPMAASIDGSPASLDAVKAGARVDLRASWPAEDAETYVRLNPDAQSIETHRESMRVSWFAAAGVFDSDRTGRGEDDPESTTDNAWRAPDAPGTVPMWIVLRDSRGGLDFASVTITVVP